MERASAVMNERIPVRISRGTAQARSANYHPPRARAAPRKRISPKAAAARNSRLAGVIVLVMRPCRGWCVKSPGMDRRGLLGFGAGRWSFAMRMEGVFLVHDFRELPSAL